VREEGRVEERKGGGWREEDRIGQKMRGGERRGEERRCMI
jgi:hypothetical protein